MNSDFSGLFEKLLAILMSSDFYAFCFRLPNGCFYPLSTIDYFSDQKVLYFLACVDSLGTNINLTSL
jgi:hypothetical protein